MAVRCRSVQPLAHLAPTSLFTPGACAFADKPVYQFLDKKRTEGKPYFVYMTAVQNKFLRIYYARVKECLEAFDAQQNPAQS